MSNFRKNNTRRPAQVFRPNFERIAPHQFDEDNHYLFRRSVSDISDSAPPNALEPTILSAFLFHSTLPYMVNKVKKEDPVAEDQDGETEEVAFRENFITNFQAKNKFNKSQQEKRLEREENERKAVNKSTSQGDQAILQNLLLALTQNTKK